MGNESRLGRFLGRFRKNDEFLPPKLSPQGEIIRERLLDPHGSTHFRNLREFLTPDEERRYIELLPDVVEREEKLRVEYVGKEKPPGWQTTDPKNHDPDNFRYIVHTIINTKNDYVASLRGEPKVDYSTRPWTDLDGFLARNMTSCTLVDELHRGTYVQDQVPHGFILEVPEENIVAIDPFDMGKPWDMQDKKEAEKTLWDGIQRKQNTPSAQAFFDEGVSGWYNEVVVDGIGPQNRNIQISGIFMIVDPVLGIPQYEIKTRLSRTRQQEIAKLAKKGYKEEDVENIIPGYGTEKWFIQRMKDRYQQAKDLSELLKVPIVPIPQLIHPQWYRKYILPEK